MLAEREARYGTRYPHPGWAEQSPLDWWEALGKASRALMRDLGSPRVDGICAATTASTVVVCKRDGAPLRPALLWMDCRAAGEAERTAASRHPVMSNSGGADAAEWLVPKAMWLSRREPETYASAEVICECLDYVNFRLTGRWVGSRMNATCKWNYDSERVSFRRRGVRGVRRSGPCRETAPGHPPGRRADRASVAAEAAEHLGLPTAPRSLRVASTRISAWSGANTMEPGELLLIGGTSIVSCFSSPGDACRRVLGALPARPDHGPMACRSRSGVCGLRALLGFERHVRVGRGGT